MINDKAFNNSGFGWSRGSELQSSWLPQAQSRGVAGPDSFNPKQGNGNSSYGPTDNTAISAEASEPDGGDGSVSPLLQGLQGWGNDENFGAGRDQGARDNVGQSQEASGSAATGRSQPPSQVPVSILNQVLNTLKTAGGMATVGALQSLLSWGSSELENSGKIRPEFQDILHEAIDFAKENRIMSPEDLAKYENELFSKDKDKGDEGKKGGCSGCKGKGKSAKESIEFAAA